MATDHPTLCPSAQAHWPEARVFGVVGGTADAPATAYLPAPQPITEQLLQLAGPLRPGEVFRVAAPCANGGCVHFSTERAQCRLVAKTVRWVPAVVEALPACAIRPACRWWQQEGKAACLRCPQVVTDDCLPSPETRNAANPALQ